MILYFFMLNQKIIFGINQFSDYHRNNLLKDYKIDEKGRLYKAENLTGAQPQKLEILNVEDGAKPPARSRHWAMVLY
jgi:hypothetical protein